MKGKKILTLASLAMGVAIVGATFAAWAVTDNADPFGIKVSPGKVGPDTTQFVTLSYGTSTFANVDNLKAGEPRLAGSVLLKAETNDGEVFPYAVFDVELKDQTGAKAEGVAKLVNLLNVDVYDAEIKKASDGETLVNEMVVDSSITSAEKFAESLALNGKLYKKVESVYTPVTAYAESTTYYKKGAALVPIGHIPTNEGKVKSSIPVEIPSETGLPVYVVVSLASSTDAKTLEEIAADVVYLEMNLNKAESGDYTTATKIYLNQAIGSNEAMYCYAWSDSNKNGDWPGVEMTYEAATGLWSYDLKTEFTNLIFSIQNTEEELTTTWQTIDLTVDHVALASNPVFTPGSQVEGKYTGTWGKLPDPDIVKGYYVVGDKIGDGQFSPVKETLMAKVGDDDTHYKKEMTFVKGEKIKVCNENRTVWFSCLTTWDENLFTLDDDKNIIITNAGTYTVDLYTEGLGGNCIVLTPKTPA